MEEKELKSLLPDIANFNGPLEHLVLNSNSNIMGYIFHLDNKCKLFVAPLN